MNYTNQQKLIPRFPHETLGHLLIQYFVFVRYSEEYFAGILWGEEAARVLCYHAWVKNGKTIDSPALSAILRKYTGADMADEFGISLYRHSAAAIGDWFSIGNIDPYEDVNLAVHAQAGRTTATSDRIYAQEVGKVGELTPRVTHTFFGLSVLWHARILKLKVNSPVVPLPDLLTHTKLPSPPSSSTSISAHDLQAAVTAALATILPNIVDTIVQQVHARFDEAAVTRDVQAHIAAQNPGPQVIDPADARPGQADDDDDLYVDVCAHILPNISSSINTVPPV